MGVNVFVNAGAIHVDGHVVVTFGQLFPERVANEGVHSGLGFLLVGPVVQTSYFRLYLFEQFYSDGFQFFDVLLAQVVLEKQVIHGEFFVVLETFTDKALLLGIHGRRQIHQVHKGLFDGRTVLFAIVGVDDFLVTLVEIDSAGVGRQQQRKSLFY